MSLRNYDLSYQPNLGVFPAQHLAGQVRRPGMNYRIVLEWDGYQLKGRLGGRIFGENVLLQARGDELLGSVASSGWVYSVHARKQDNAIECSFVGARNISSANLEITSTGITGRIFGHEASHTVAIEQTTGGLRAKIGRDAEYQETVLEYSGALNWELLVGILIADITGRNAWRALLASYQGSAEG